MTMRDEPIRVAQIIGKLASGGVEAVVNNYWCGMDHEAFRFDYYIDEDSVCEPSREMLDSGAVYRTIPSSRHPAARVKALTALLKQYPPQIVHSHMNSLNVFSLYAARRAGIPVRISHSHSTSDRREVLRTAVKGVLRRTGGWFATDRMACGDRAARWLFGDRAVDAGEVFILPNAIDVEKYRFSPEARGRVRQELGLEDAFVVGHVGRFATVKNHAFLIRAFAALKTKRADAALLLAGDGELRPEAEKLARDLGVGDSVIFTGNREDAADLYSAMDVFALPSLYEGFPVVGTEAQANGLPCLFSDHISRELEGDIRFLPLRETEWAEAFRETDRVPEGKRAGAADRLKGSRLDRKVSASLLEAYYKKKADRPRFGGRA